MGKAIKLKEQRKIEKLEIARKKAKRVRLIVWTVTAVIALPLIGFGAVKVGYWAKNRYFPNRATQTPAKTYKTGEHKYSQAPDMQIDPNKNYIAKFETSAGNFEAELNAKEAPKTVNNFVVLARDNFYNGLSFHRIMEGFMIQGGDPDGDGGGGPGYTVPAEIKLKHTTGAIAMARLGDEANPNKDSSGSQFFIDLADQPTLDQGGYTVFGYIISGMDVVQKLGKTEVTANEMGENSKPVKAPVINKITIEEK